MGPPTTAGLPDSAKTLYELYQQYKTLIAAGQGVYGTLKHIFQQQEAAESGETLQQRVERFIKFVENASGGSFLTQNDLIPPGSPGSNFGAALGGGSSGGIASVPAKRPNLN
jgi:hypothetical protein